MTTEPLEAWLLRADWSTRDTLWRAACWVTAGLESPTDRGRHAAFDRAAEIVAGDIDAAIATVQTLPPHGAEWPRAKRGAWK